MAVVDGDTGRVDGDESDVSAVGVVRKQTVEIRRARVVDVLSMSLVFKRAHFKNLSSQ